jgi:hypothetical protein
VSLEAWRQDWLVASHSDSDLVCACVCRKGPVSEWVPVRITPTRGRATDSSRTPPLVEEEARFKTCRSLGKMKNILCYTDLPTELVVRELRALKVVRAFRQCNVVMRPMRLGTSNHCAGEAQQQFSMQAVSRLSVVIRSWWWARK